MAFKIRTISKKQELNQPDEFISTLDWISETVQTRTKEISILLGVLVLAAAVVGGYFWNQSRQEGLAAQLQAKADTIYRDAASTAEVAQTGAGTAEVRFRDAVKAYQEVVTNYPGTRAASMSQYYIGNSYLDLGDYDQAIQALESFIDQDFKFPVLEALVRQRLGYAYLLKGDTEAAQGAFGGVIRIEEALNKSPVLYESGRLHEVQGEKEEAILRYQKIIKDYPHSLIVPDARVRLRELGVEESEPAIEEESEPVEGMPTIESTEEQSNSTP